MPFIKLKIIVLKMLIRNIDEIKPHRKESKGIMNMVLRLTVTLDGRRKGGEKMGEERKHRDM